jgi:hypothetical protein
MAERETEVQGTEGAPLSRHPLSFRERGRGEGVIHLSQVPVQAVRG